MKFSFAASTFFQLIAIGCLLASGGPANAQTDPLPSRDSGPAKQAIMKGTTDQASSRLVPPPESNVTFLVYRNGENVGRHTLAFEEKGGSRIVTVNVDITVQKLGVIAFRYTHRGNEVSKEGQLVSLHTSTDDNGRLYTVECHRSARGLEVERTAPPSMSPAEVMDSGLPKPEASHEALAANTLPTTLWNVEAVRRSELLNTQYGTLSRFKVKSLRRETVSLKSGNRETTRYHFTGDLQMDQWFDDDGRWVKATFRAPDGSTVDYILAESQQL